MHHELLRKHSSFPVTYVLLDKDAARWKDCRVLTFYSNSSHFNTWLKKETTSCISEAAVFCFQSCCELFISSSAWHFALPPSLVPSINMLVVITTQIFCRFTLGLPKYSVTQNLNTYQSWEKKIQKKFFFGYWSSSYSSILMVLFGSADGEWKGRSLLPTIYTTSRERCYPHSGPMWQSHSGSESG